MIRVVSIVLIWANFTGAVVSNWNTPLPGTAGRGNESIIWAGSVLELSSINTHLFQCNVTVEGTATYRLLNDSDGRFRINSTTGSVFTHALLDYEQTPTLQIIIEATDSQDSGRGTATVTVKVQDLNDNSPMFTSSVYNVSVSDGAKAGTTVHHFSALDRDGPGPNSHITYKIKSQDTSGNGTFVINSTTGVLSVANNKTINRAEKSEYKFDVIAMDAGVPSNSGTAMVTIHVVGETKEKTSKAPNSLRMMWTTCVITVILARGVSRMRH
ncbi:protocadherin-1-like [Mya arenaria]|uniref:protocadherin-1-like n=1 Tax=Mya arenaria TaxID=6604 RepID=UPI0022E02707|nr:protocadherin-1-like [Mya arenaria]